MGHETGNTEDSALILLAELQRKKHSSSAYPQEPKNELLISGELAVRIHNAINAYHKRFGEDSKLPEPSRIDHVPFFNSIVNRLTENIKDADPKQKRVKAFNVRAEEKAMFRHVFEGKSGVWENIEKQEDSDMRNLKSPLLEELLRRINVQIDCIVYNSTIGINPNKGTKKPLKPNEFVMLEKSQLNDFLIHRLFKKNGDLYIRENTRYHKVFLATLKNEIAALLSFHLKFSQAEINELIEKLEPQFDRYGTIYFYQLANELSDFVDRKKSQAGGKN